jgi:hypothetical protein
VLRHHKGQPEGPSSSHALSRQDTTLVVKADARGEQAWAVGAPSMAMRDWVGMQPRTTDK